MPRSVVVELMTQIKNQRARFTILPAVLAVAALAVGCGSSDDATTFEDPPASSGAPVPGPGEVVQTDGAAGTLIPSPEVVGPGDVLSVQVDNQGTRRLDYGLANSVERYVDGDWIEATAEVYEGGPPAFIEILLTLGGGMRGEPEEIALSQTVEPGTYRVVKDVFVQGGTVPDQLTLGAIFEVSV